MNGIINFETTGRSKVVFQDRADLRKKVVELAQKKTAGGRLDFKLLSVEAKLELCEQTKKFLIFAATDPFQKKFNDFRTISDAVRLFRKLTTEEYQNFCNKGDLDIQVMDMEIDLAILVGGGELRTIKEIL